MGFGVWLSMAEIVFCIDPGWLGLKNSIGEEMRLGIEVLTEGGDLFEGKLKGFGGWDLRILEGEHEREMGSCFGCEGKRRLEEW